MQAGDVIEGSGTTIAIGTVGHTLVGIVIAAACVPVVVIVNAHLETLNGLSAAPEEIIGHLKEDISRTTLSDTRCQIG